ncbi:MAG: electron transfer flavoprotein subunit alpha/FixB family protein [Gammaproteobacteria bacterium]|nr:electron transfer flavoprotein subunit alpha/FixB family protein [Gammaproteobacteria bacterium]
MARVLIVAEHDGSSVLQSTAKCVACAAQMEPEAVDVVVFAGDPDSAARLGGQAAGIEGVTRVLAIADPANAHAVAAVLAPQIVDTAREYSHVLGPSTTFGKDLMPRVAALLGVGQISDIMAVEAPYRFRRPAYAGNVIETVECEPDGMLVGTVRAASYRPSPAASSPAPIEQRETSADLPRHTLFVELKAQQADRPDLQTASRVVAGGRAFGSAENFALVEQLAEKLGAAVGASRAAVDAGYASNDLQVGQTGKVIAPDLYVALGISGAIQHLTGIKDARTIVAVNRDPEAPIFEIADIGLVADVFEAVPALIAALEQRRR